MVDHAYITLSAIGFFLNIVPFAWQVEHRNSGPICLGFWVLLLNLFNFVCSPSEPLSHLLTLYADRRSYLEK
jgi:hypothetical protein